MGGEWTTATIEECTDTIIDYRGKTPKKSDHGIPLVTAKIVKGGRVQTPNEFIRVEDYDSWMRRGIPQPGDVVMTTEAPLGEVAQLPDYILALAQRVIVMRGKQEQLDNRYFKYLLLSEEVQAKLQARASGSTVRGIKQKELRKVVISFPRMEHQKAVGSILGSLDDKIELNHHLNTLLEQTAQAIFHSWFVAFDPVRAKARALEVGCDPERAAMGALSGKLRVPANVEELEEEDFRAAEGRLEELSDEQRKELAETAGLFPGGLVESEVGLVPEGWGVSEIGKETSIFGGATPSTKNSNFWEEGTYAWCTPKDLSNARSLALVDTERKITFEGVQKISSGQLPVGTVLLSSRAPVGYVSIAAIPVSINQGFIALVCDKSLPNSYVFFWLKENMSRIEGRASGSTFAEISKKNFRPILCVVPCSTSLGRFHQCITPFIDQIERLTHQIHRLTDLRDTLLPRLISGELSVEGVGG